MHVFRTTFFVLAALLSTTVRVEPLSADTIFLRNGQVLENVVSVANEGGFLIIFRDGSTMGLKKEQVQRIQVQTVLWKPEKIIENRDAPAGNSDQENGEQKEPIPDHSANEDKYPYSLVPGWQQYREGRIAKSALFVGLFAGSLVGIEDARYLYSRMKDRSRFPPVLNLYFQMLSLEQSGWEVLIVSNSYIMQLNKDQQLRTHNLEGAYLAAFTIYVLNFLDAIFFSPAGSAHADEQDGVQFLFAFAPLTGEGRTEFNMGFQATF